MEKQLIFVYNASSQVMYKYLDVAHKIVSPSTYSCGLCSLTHGNFSEKAIWKSFKTRVTTHELVFEYKNDFQKRYPAISEEVFSYPVVLEKVGDRWKELVSAIDFQQFDQVEGLIDFLKKKIGDS